MQIVDLAQDKKKQPAEEPGGLFLFGLSPWPDLFFTQRKLKSLKLFELIAVVANSISTKMLQPVVVMPPSELLSQKL